MLLELCAYTIASCRIAAEAGVGRVELCSDPAQGGTTPGIGMVRTAMDMGLTVFPMVRPRGGDFVYGADELEVIHREIRAFRDLGCPGIVTGMLRRDGTIDADRMKRAVDLAGPMAVTCHKAFDAVPDGAEALEALVDAGCARVLTSGLAPDAVAGSTVIAGLVKQAAGRITILVGGGVRSGNIRQLMGSTGAKEFHSSAITTRSAQATADEEEVCALLREIRKG